MESVEMNRDRGVFSDFDALYFYIFGHSNLWRHCQRWTDSQSFLDAVAEPLIVVHLLILQNVLPLRVFKVLKRFQLLTLLNLSPDLVPYGSILCQVVDEVGHKNCWSLSACKHDRHTFIDEHLVIILVHVVFQKYAQEVSSFVFLLVFHLLPSFFNHGEDELSKRDHILKGFLVLLPESVKEMLQKGKKFDSQGKSLAESWVRDKLKSLTSCECLLFSFNLQGYCATLLLNSKNAFFDSFHDQLANFLGQFKLFRRRSFYLFDPCCNLWVGLSSNLVQHLEEFIFVEGHWNMFSLLTPFFTWFDKEKTISKEQISCMRYGAVLVEEHILRGIDFVDPFRVWDIENSIIESKIKKHFRWIFAEKFNGIFWVNIFQEWGFSFHYLLEIQHTSYDRERELWWHTLYFVVHIGVVLASHYPEQVGQYC